MIHNHLLMLKYDNRDDWDLTGCEDGAGSTVSTTTIVYYDETIDNDDGPYAELAKLYPIHDVVLENTTVTPTEGHLTYAFVRYTRAKYKRTNMGVLPFDDDVNKEDTSTDDKIFFNRRWQILICHYSLLDSIKSSAVMLLSLLC
jgi:hypothetical protein